jgi:Zn-dependent metalloprotease
MRHLLLTNLSMLLASGMLAAQGLHPVLRPAELANRASALPQGKAKAANLLQASKAILGIRNDFAIRSSALNTQGQVVVRADQTFDGFRVWGASTVVRVNPDGTSETTASSLETSIALSGEPRLDQDRALGIAHADIAPRGAYVTAPRVERIVFPSRFTGGLQFVTDQATGSPVLDRVNSVRAPRPAVDHVWAYEVVSVLHNPLDGTLEMHHIVDGDTGAILRKWNGVRNLATSQASARSRGLYASAAPGPVRVEPLRVAVRAGAGEPTAAVGTGNSQYLGTVQLDTSRNDADGFDLVDTTRGSLLNTRSSLGNIHNTTYFADTSNWDGWAMYGGDNGDADNVWGDGKNYTDPIQPSHAADANGQTAAVDAHFGMMTTWDFYKNVFNRLSVDGLGTGLCSVVHEPTYDTLADGSTVIARYENAMWITDLGMMFYGDGGYSADNPGGMFEMTELDITGHEITHGVSAYTAGFDGAGEAAGLNEGTSDILGTMVEAYATRAKGADASIPPTGADWLIGAKAGNGIPLRLMTKPSLDGVSADAWYSGIGFLDSHFSLGPLDRFFYFLSQGASADPKADTYSPYLPGGMAGIGNDPAARIWYKALTEHLSHDSGYQDGFNPDGSLHAEGARTAALKAAEDLYGAGSAEVIAVEDAFAAVNVGVAHGAAPRIQVLPFRANTVGPVAPFNPYIQYVAAGQSTVLRVDVENTSNTAVTWQLGGALGSTIPYEVGKLNGDGTWTAPFRPGKVNLRSTSVADPLQWGEMQFYIANLDSDDDVETDAVDQGAIALSWGLDEALTPVASVWGNYQVDDLDVYIFGEAFKAAFVR